jgi:hypothetical protein
LEAIGTIYLSWRKGKGSRRKIVGCIKKNATDGVRFEYIEKGVFEAQQEGFTPYIDFPDTSKVYTENVLEIFGQRLIKTERSDIQRYLDFWDVDPKYQGDKYYLLAYTQGMLSTDNFEFLASFHPVKNLCFVSEVVGLSKTLPKPGVIEIGDKLEWTLEKKNPVDKYAVKVYKRDFFLGYVKMVHSRVFHSIRSASLKIKVKSIDQNGSVNRIFIEVSF